MSAFMKEIDAIQPDMVCMEGMLEALVKGAYAGTGAEYIGNSLEISGDYLGRRAEAAYGRLSPYLEKLSGKQQEALCLVIRDIGTASRKQGFTEGFTAAVGRICGEGDTDG